MLTLNRPTICLKDGREIISVSGLDVSDGIFVNPNANGTILTITVPQQQVLVINKAANFLDDNTALGYVTWKLKIDGIPVPGYDNITTLIGLSAIHDVTEDIVVYETSVLTFEATNNTAFVYRIGASIGGTFGVWKHTLSGVNHGLE